VSRGRDNEWVKKTAGVLGKANYRPYVMGFCLTQFVSIAVSRRLKCATAGHVVWRRLLVRQEEHGGKVVYVCDCGLGYDDVLIAFACEDYKRAHGVNSEEIIKRATFNPRDEPKRRVITTS